MIKNERALLNYITTMNDFTYMSNWNTGECWGQEKQFKKLEEVFSNISEKYKFTGRKSSMNPKQKYEGNYSETHHNEIAQNQ